MFALPVRSHDKNYHGGYREYCQFEGSVYIVAERFHNIVTQLSSMNMDYFSKGNVSGLLVFDEEGLYGTLFSCI